MKVTLQGRSFTVTEESVERVADEEPDTIQRYAVEIKGRRYPLKQAAAKGIDVPPAAFTSQQAYLWLTKLGFDVLDLRGAGR